MPDLWQAALAVLRQNDLGGWTKPAPRLYPHQWSWDSAFIAIGLAHVDPDRALRELEVLFEAQWTDGRVPHIVFNPEAHDYFPGPDIWAAASSTAAAPRAPQTSGLVQPPVHALAAWQLSLVAGDLLRQRLSSLYPKLLAWHRYLATARDPEGSGLLSIYHPWESGTDNSPRWDEALARVQANGLPELIIGRTLQGLASGAAAGAVGAGMLDLHRANGTLANAIAPVHAAVVRAASHAVGCPCLG